jgi:hypothetical protein
LLPRLVTAAPAEISELRTVGVGLGVGEGVGIGVGVAVGVGVGVGVGVCAWADEDATATASAKTIETARTSLRPAAFCHARKGRVEPRINAIPKNLRQLGKKSQNSIGRVRFALSSPGPSIGHGRARRPIAGHCCSVATVPTGDLVIYRAAPEAC